MKKNLKKLSQHCAVCAMRFCAFLKAIEDIAVLIKTLKLKKIFLDRFHHIAKWSSAGVIKRSQHIKTDLIASLNF
jgi:hypothetical protein